MPEESFRLNAETTQVVQEPVDPSTWTVNLEFGTPTTPSRVVVILRVRDQNGEWRNARLDNDGRFEIADDLRKDESGEFINPRAKIATLVCNAILDAVVQSTPATSAAGIAGLTVREIGIQLIRQQHGGNNGLAADSTEN